jgi:anaerobic selenocysteine-containing dehydrogenase
VGLGDYFDNTVDYYNAIRLDTEYPLIAGIDPPLTLERLKEEKMVRSAAPPDVLFDPFEGLQFGSPTGKIEFYAEKLHGLGLALPKYLPVLESPVIDGNSKHPYQFFTGRQRFFMQSMFTDDPLMVDMSGGRPTARMNPTDAKAEGLRDHDKIEVFNDRGHVVLELRVEEAIPPGTVQVWFGWRKRQFEEGTYAEMLIPNSDDIVINDVADQWFDDFVAAGNIVSGMAAGSLALEIGAWDTFWDCACAVRKAS